MVFFYLEVQKGNMKQRLIVGCIAVLLWSGAWAQDGPFTSNKSKVSFFSSAPLEDISAVNTEATATINPANNEVVVHIPIKAFDFSDKLMEEHFNEHYLETDKFPFATFRGKINEPVDWKRLGRVEVSANGLLSIHGVSQQRTIQGALIVGNNGVQLDSKFKVKLADHGIAIPKLVFQKIAEQVDVTCQFVYLTKK